MLRPDIQVINSCKTFNKLIKGVANWLAYTWLTLLIDRVVSLCLSSARQHLCFDYTFAPNWLSFLSSFWMQDV